MNRFLRKCLQLLKYGALIIAGSLYIWALIFLLKSDNWVGISALTTMILAIAAFWAIWQNRTLQISERKERLLNEIIEWALEVPNCCKEDPFSSKYAGIKNEWEHKIMAGFELISKCINLEERGKYIKQVAPPFGQDLENAVGETISIIEERIKLLAKSMGKKPIDVGKDINKLLEKAKEEAMPLGENAKILDESVRKVIEKVCKIKTRDID